MYYNRILRLWVLDPSDYFLLSAILGSIVASCLKDYLSEKKARERLKNSIIKKSKLIIESKNGVDAVAASRNLRIQRIYNLARGRIIVELTLPIRS